MKLEDAILVMGSLKQQLMASGNLRKCSAVNQVTAVLLSPLFSRCYDIVTAINTTSITTEINALLTRASIQPVFSNLPPLKADPLRRRVEQFHIAADREIYFVELPPPTPDYLQKRCGLIMRQQMVDGEVRKLYVAGVEQDSPASRAHNICSGDEILVISGFPLDHCTMEQLRYGLLDSPEVAGIHTNANLYELADGLLNAPYRWRSTSGIPLKMPTLIVARKPPSPNQQCTDAETQGERLGSFYHETVLPTATDQNEFGIKFGYNEDETCIYIQSIAPESKASLDGILKEGDQVVEINYHKLDHLSAPEALKQIERICSTASFINIKTFRPLPKKDTSIRSAEAARSHFVTHKALSYDSASSSENAVFGDFDCSDSTMTTLVQFPSQGWLDTDKTAQVNRLNSIDPAHAILFWSSRLPLNVEIIDAEYDLGTSQHGLGITIEGTIEKTGLNAPQEPHHYIVEVLPESCEGIRSRLLPGDELLQLNNDILFHTPHLEVARLLHEAPTIGHLICARPKRGFSIETIIEEDKFGLDADDASPEELSDTTLGSDRIVNGKSPKTRTSSSEQTSDVDKLPQCPRIMYPRKSLQKLANGTDIIADNIKMVVDRRITPEEHSGEIPNHRLRTRPVNSRSSAGNNCYQENVMEMMALPKAMSVTRTEPTATVESCSSTLYRLPMPVRIASVGVSTGDQDDVFTLHSATSTVTDSKPHHSVSFCENEQCWNVSVFKQSGEWLGVELDTSDGGPNGIKLCQVTPGSPLDTALSNLRHRYQPPPSPLKPHKVHQELRLLQLGDWILSVAGHSLRNKSGVDARIILRHLVMHSGCISIKYLPGNSIEQ